MSNNYADLIAKRDELNRQIEAALKAERSGAIAQAKELISQFQLSAAELGLAGKTVAAPSKTRKPVEAKYRGPKGETWTGRGRTPGWLAALEAAGQKRESFLI